MQSKATTVAAYLAGLSPERRRDVAKVRAVIKKNLPRGYHETMQYGMISYVVPESVLPAAEVYNGQLLAYVALAAQKNYNAVYLLNVYGDSPTARWFASRYKASGKKLDMGKSCVRFKTADDLPLDLIGQTVARTPLAMYVARYRAVRGTAKRSSTRT